MTTNEAINKLISHSRPADPLAGQLAVICVNELFKEFGGIYASFNTAVAFLCPLMNVVVNADTMEQHANGMVAFAKRATLKTQEYASERAHRLNILAVRG